jgi:hypothetical protein
MTVGGLPHHVLRYPLTGMQTIEVGLPTLNRSHGGKASCYIVVVILF